MCPASENDRQTAKKLPDNGAANSVLPLIKAIPMPPRPAITPYSDVP